MSNKTILIAHIVDAHGINGMVKIRSFALEDLLRYKYLYDKYGNKYEIIQCKFVAKNLIVKFKHIINRTEAEKLKNSYLYIKAEQLAPLEDEEFYYKDLIGLIAKDIKEHIYGYVIAVHDFGAGELLEIKDKDSFFVPFKSIYVPNINLSDKSLILSEAAITSFID